MTTEVFKTATLRVRPRRLWDFERFVTARARDKSVLHIGAAGNICHYLPENKSLYFHSRLMGSAREVVGVDIDREGVDYAGRHGIEIVHADCQDMDLGRKFDVIVMLDVVEHLEHPGKALDCLMAHLMPSGELIVSTPNPTGLGVIAKAWLGLSLKVYWDHVAGYLPEHLQVLCDRHRLALDEIRFFTHYNRWSAFSRFKSVLYALAGWLAPRTNNAFLVVIRHDQSRP